MALHRLITMDVPGYIRDALERVRLADPECLVAGGCLRDTFFGVPVKDVDVFVTGWFEPEYVPVEDGEVVLEERGISMIQSYGAGGDHRGPLQGWSLYVSPVPIQMIRRTFLGVADLLSDMDFGFCQIAYDGEDVWVTDAFINDVVRNTATYMAPSGTDRFERAIRRAERLAVKYPNRRFRVIQP